MIARRAEPGQAGASIPHSDDERPEAHDHATGPQSLAEVYAAHAGFVWRTVRRLGVPPQAVEDVMHEVFLVVHRRLPEFDGRAAMTTWLFHLCRGVVSNWRRGQKRAQARLALVTPPRNAMPDPEQAIERGQAADFVRQFVASLDADKRLIFELSEVDGLPMQQIAELAGVNLNTAYSRLRAARQAFARAVDRRSQRIRGAG